MRMETSACFTYCWALVSGTGRWVSEHCRPQTRMFQGVFTHYLLSSYRVPGTDLGCRHNSKLNKPHCSYGAGLVEGRQ